jgi:hypothetical protein
MTESGPQEFDDLEPLPKKHELTELEPLDELEPLEELEPLAELEPLVELEPIAEESKPVPPKPEVTPPAPKPEVKPPPAPAPAAPKPEVEPPATPAPSTPQPEVKPPTPPSTGAKPAAAAAVATAGDASKPRKSQEERDREKAERAAAKKAELDARLGKIEGKRELEAAPLMLRKASLILLAASLLPFGSVMTAGAFVGKLILLCAAFVFHQGHVHKAGEKAAGFIPPLAKNGLMPVLALSGLLAIAAFVVPNFIGEFPISSMGEMVALALACFTFTHIFDYEHGGKFNPIYPMLFLGPAIMGLLGILKLSEASGLTMMAAALGSLGVAIAGFMAVYTMFVAIKQAKIEGDLKKQAATEARKAAREARRK